MTDLLSPRVPSEQFEEEPFTIGVDNRPEGTLITVVGELDTATGPQLEGALLRLSGTGATTLDCSALTFCDSTGLSVLIRAHQHHQARGATLQLRNITPGLHRILSIVGLDRYLDASQ